MIRVFMKPVASKTTQFLAIVKMLIWVNGSSFRKFRAQLWINLSIRFVK